MKREIAEILTNEGLFYFQYNPEDFGELQRAILENVPENSVLFVETYPIH